MERYGKGAGLMPALRVERQVQYKDSKLDFFPPKYNSYRSLVLPWFLAEMLETLLASHDSPWVFTGIEGGCLARVNFDYDYWRPIADGCDARVGPLKPRPEMPAVPSFKGKRMYLLRHGHKPWLDEDGHPRVAVEHRMGHELPGVEGTYSNVTPAMEAAIMKSLQVRWTAFRASLPPEEAAPMLPTARVPSVAGLVRSAWAVGLRDGRAILEEVRKVRPDANADTVVTTVGRHRRAMATTSPSASH
ncbi:hypothetical protein ABZ829_00490 [Streptomyces xanthochromogenes]|uniref:hypothetical protein n=1 Tax=Streptomyces xanthochromogenes TaxID=67384 RepID=UPI00341D2931